MRLAMSAAVALVSSLCVALPAYSERSLDGDVATGAPAVQERTPQLEAVLSELRARAINPQSAEEAAWISELTGYYASAPDTLLWIDGSGFNAKAEGVIGELKRAGDYGLDASQFVPPPPPSVVTPSGPQARAQAEVALSLAASKYAWHAHGGRADPSKLSLWIDQKPRPVYASSLMIRFAKASDAAEILRAEHPQHPQFELLRKAYVRARDGISDPLPDPIPLGPVVAEGERHHHIALLRERLGMTSSGDGAERLDEELGDEIRRIMKRAGFKKRRSLDDDVRRLVNAMAAGRDHAPKTDIPRYLANLERWRSVPRDFGPTHIWNNLPEFETKLVTNGEIIHRERIIIGQPHTQTPVFSDFMSHVIFQPTWGVPPSIKIRQVLPRLRGGDLSVLERRNMKIMDDRRVIRPAYFNWSKVDIRNVPIVQGPGPGNPLGRLKFMFPNAHDVYMHDTPDKYLFETSDRTYSHGCIRLRNPEKFAEVVLGLKRGWTQSDVQTQLKDRETHQVNLLDPIPVHNTYFTIIVDEATGKVRSLKDVYGHDQRITEALSGVPVARIAARDPALAQLRQNQELAKRSGANSPKWATKSQFAALGRPQLQDKPKKKKFFLFSIGDDD